MPGLLCCFFLLLSIYTSIQLSYLLPFLQFQVILLFCLIVLSIFSFLAQIPVFSFPHKISSLRANFHHELDCTKWCLEYYQETCKEGRSTLKLVTPSHMLGLCLDKRRKTVEVSTLLFLCVSMQLHVNKHTLPKPCTATNLALPSLPWWLCPFEPGTKMDLLYCKILLSSILSQQWKMWLIPHTCHHAEWCLSKTLMVLSLSLVDMLPYTAKRVFRYNNGWGPWDEVIILDFLGKFGLTSWGFKNRNIPWLSSERDLTVSKGSERGNFTVWRWKQLKSTAGLQKQENRGIWMAVTDIALS